MNNKYMILLALGIFMTSLSQMLQHYVDWSDFANGAAAGIGFGLMVLGIYQKIKFSKS